MEKGISNIVENVDLLLNSILKEEEENKDNRIYSLYRKVKEFKKEVEILTTDLNETKDFVDEIKHKKDECNLTNTLKNYSKGVSKVSKEINDLSQELKEIKEDRKAKEKEKKENAKTKDKLDEIKLKNKKEKGVMTGGASGVEEEMLIPLPGNSEEVDDCSIRLQGYLQFNDNTDKKMLLMRTFFNKRENLYMAQKVLEQKLIKTRGVFGQ